MQDPTPDLIAELSRALLGYETSVLVPAGVRMLDEAGRNDTSQTRGSLFADPPELRGSVLEGRVGASAPWSLFVHDGRQPGKPPPFRKIQAWVERKLRPEPGAVYPITRAIQRKIALRGTVGTPFLKRPVEVTWGQFAQDAADLVAARTAEAVARGLSTPTGSAS